MKNIKMFEILCLNKFNGMKCRLPHNVTFHHLYQSSMLIKALGAGGKFGPV